MPPESCKPVFPPALARAISAALVVLVAIVGCSTQTQQNTRTSAKQPVKPRITVQKRPIDVELKPVSYLVLEPKEYVNVWDRIRNGFQLQDKYNINPRIERQRLWFIGNPSFIAQSSRRGSMYMHYIVERLEERNMPLELALLPIIESAYNPFALSRSNAAGIWQFIPTTGRHFNLQQNHAYDGRRDITASTNAALTYLDRLYNMFNGDWLLALAAYNSGEGTVSRAIERNQKLGLPTDYWNLPLPQETRDYVPKLLALAQIVQTPRHYGILLEPINNQPYFAAVKVKRGIDLNQVAARTGLDVNELHHLNPAFKQRITTHEGAHLLVPTDKVAELTATLTTIKPVELRTWQNHQVRRGESLYSIANRYRMSVAELKAANKLSSNRIKPGQKLLIPSRQNGTAARQVAAQTSKPAVRVHKVRSGENLWSIAKKSGVSVNELKRWNNLSRTQLKIGQTLKIHSSTQKQTAAAQKNSQKPTYYKVRRGDSLYLIAKRFNVDVKTLQRWNPGQGRLLKPGQTLTLYQP